MTSSFDETAWAQMLVWNRDTRIPSGTMYVVSGAQFSTPVLKCFKCKGKGQVEKKTPIRTKDFLTKATFSQTSNIKAWINCPRCFGRGVE